MKKGSLIAGIILLIIGVSLYGILQTNANDCSSFVGQLGRAFSPTTAQNCQTVAMVQVLGMILGVIGLGVLIYGAVAKSSSRYSSVERSSRSRKLALIILGMIGIVIVFQMLFPWPYGLIGAIAIVLVLVYYIRKRKVSYNKEPPISTPPKEETQEEKNIRNLGILKERLARGEITKEEYDELKKVFEPK